MKKLKILFTGEAIDDHIFVIKEVIKEMDKIIEKEKNVEFKASYMGSSPGSSKIKEWVNVKTKIIFSSMFLFPLSFIQSFFYLFVDTPDIIFTKGGQISFPIIISAQILRIPIFLHITDSSLSSTDKFIAKRSLIVFTSFNNTKGLEKKKELRLGYPIKQKPLSDYLLAKTDLSIPTKEKRPILFFVSKLENSEKINDFILNILNDLVKKFYIFHETTKEKYDQAKKESEIILSNNSSKNFYHIFYLPNLDKLKNIYTVSDIIVSEFSEKIMFEISTLQKPSILIIFPNKKIDSKEKQKIESAYSYANTEAGIIIEEANLKRGLLLNKLDSLFEEPSGIENLKKMSEKAKEFSTPDAGKLMATYLFEYWKFRIQ